MRAFVTGGTGFVGSFLIEQLRAMGDEVVAIVRPGSNAAFVESLGAKVHRGDLDDPASLKDACRNCDVVYHAAARVEIVGTEEEFQRTTVDGTRHLVAAANAAGVRRFVYVSSCGVYDPRLMASGQVIYESTPTGEPPHWFPYGRAKLAAERVVQSDVRSPAEWVIVRLGYLYGPRNRTMRSYLAEVFRRKIMVIIGNGENEMAMVYVEDVARAIALAGRVPEAAGQILIAGPNERVTQRQYFDTLADGFGAPRVKRRVPYSVAYFFGWLGEYIGTEFRKMVVRRSAVALTGLPQKLNCDHTQAILNWRPQTRFADGMKRAFDWYHAEYGDKPGRQ